MRKQMELKNIIYIVAGDEMKKIMSNKYPNRIIIPFREDLSIGKYEGFIIDDKFIDNRSKTFGVNKDEYYNNIKPILDIDIKKDYVLCFGEDDCCKANLNFVINYLKEKGYSKKINVNIVNEITLDTIRKYQI